MRTRRPVLTAPAGLALAIALTWVAAAPAAEPSGLIQQHVRAATFEVVQLKPPDGDVTYDREPPMDLIPYQQRIDKYRSIGTAFAIGPNRFVTASHVIGLGRGSQFGPPALRDTAGHVYDVDRVFKYSERRDFAVFSLREPPKGQKFLSPGLKPALNATVYAVGNALGEGVIIRDGVYTSDTPEELDGQWKWLRFSAAASPGNSGGPLVDEHGKVIGIVLRKSPSENLNVALPYDEILNAKEGEGRLGGRLPVRLPIMDVSETLTINESFELPKPLAEVFATVSERSLRLLWDATTRLREHNADHIFPRGAGSERLLHTLERAAFPQLMHEDPNKVWVIAAPAHQTVQLDANGFVELSQGGIRLRAPDDVRLEKLYSDDKLYLDLLLKGHALRRSVGSDSVRVTSLGKPSHASEFTDRWGRTWQVRDWAIPYDDQILTVASLRTPEGYVGTFNISSSGFIDAIHKSQELVTEFLYLTLEGTLSQWQDYLAQKGAQPRAFDAIKMRIDPGQAVTFHSDRYELDVRSDLLRLNKRSMLFLDFGFSGVGDAAIWSVDRIVVGEGSGTNNWVQAFRRTKPPSSLPEGFQSSWNKLKNQSFPFDGMIESRNGQTSISTAVRVPGAGTDATVRYALEATAEGVRTQRDMSHRLDLLERSFKVLEQGGQ